MKIILLGSFPVCTMLFESLYQQEQLQAFCFEESTLRILGNDHLESVKQRGIDTFVINKSNISSQFEIWLKDQNPDLVLICGFSLKIPESILNIHSISFFNIHFGKLPENRGPDPIFWSIKNGNHQTSITVHKMDKEWDSGPILVEKNIPIMPGETWGMLNSKMSYMLPEVARELIDSIEKQTPLESQTHNNITYNSIPSSTQRTINWYTQTVEEIENLINACNPKYGGAITYYEGGPIQIIEVSPVENQAPIFGKTPGEIIHVHPQEGLFVYCKHGNLLQINSISSDAGILSGQKYFYLGIRQGHMFTTEPKVPTHVNS